MRFHMGVSFRLKYLKKFLFPILVGVLAYFGIGILSYINVYASSNYSTTYSFTIEDQSMLNNQQYNDFTKKELLDYFNNYDSTYYNIISTFDSDNLVEFFLIPKNIESISYDLYGLNYSRYSNLGLYSTTSNFTFYGLRLPVKSYNFINSNEYNSLIDCLDNNVCWNSSSVGNIIYSKFTSLNNNIISNILSTSTNMNFNNTDSFTIDSSSFIEYFYYSQIPINLTYTQSTPSSYFYKKVTINDIEIDSSLLTYHDLYFSNDETDFIGYGESLKTFYTSLNPSSINSYSLKVNFRVPQSLLGFYQQPQDYIDNTTFDTICSGRVNHSNYYTYDSFNCSLSTTYTLTDSSIEYIFNNLSTNQSLSNYDKLFVTIKTNYLDSNISTTIYGLSYKYSLGSFFNTDFKGSIYDNFENLPLNFKVYFSSNNSLSSSNLYVKNYNFVDYNIHLIGFSNISYQQNLVIGSSILGNTNGQLDSTDFIYTNVSNNIDTGIMIYQINGSSLLPSLDLFFNSGLVISFNNSSSDDFYFIDKDGNISFGNFVKPLIESTNNYNLSYYISSINNFLNEKRDSILQLSVLTQSFYNQMPLSFQTFLFVVFVFFCLLFIFLLIKRK